MGASVRESELDRYIDRAYNQLKERCYETKISDSEFECPFCVEKRGWKYSYDDLLWHAKGRSSSSRTKDLKERGRHIALASYLKRYHSPESSSDFSAKGDIPLSTAVRKDAGKSSKLESIKEDLHDSNIGADVMREDNSKQDIRKNTVLTKDSDPSGGKMQTAHDGSEKFVFPWKGVVVNFPTQLKEGRYVGESGSKLRDELTKKGFNPTKVEPLWTFKGHSGCCIVHFTADWPGFRNAMMFEKEFESDHCSKKDWQRMKDSPGPKMFGWVAREDDYNSYGIVGKSLRKFDLKSIDDIEIEDKRKTHSLVTQLHQTIEEKDIECKVMESKLQATTISINQLMLEEDEMRKNLNEERKKMLAAEHSYLERIIGERDKLKNQIDAETKKLEWLEERKARNEHEKQQIESQRKKNELALLEQRKAEEEMMMLAEEHRKEKEELHRRIIASEKALDHKQALELELERLRGAMNVVERMPEDNTKDMEDKLKSLKEEIAEKEEELEGAESLKQALIIKERKASTEIKEARAALIDVLKTAQSSKGAKPTIGVKNVGELDSKPFQVVAKRECGKASDVKVTAEQLWSEWEIHLKDTNWKPFKIITSNKGKDEEVVDEDDERLKDLKSGMREEIYQAVVTALSEVIEYKLENRVPVPELWHNKEERRAKVKEGLTFLVNQWKMHKNRKRR